MIIGSHLNIKESDIEISFMRAQGAGGQNVNKVSSAVHLRFDVRNSSLSDFYKSRILALKDSRISKEGVIIIKAQQYRTQLKNKADALERLHQLIESCCQPVKNRIATKPSKASKKRIQEKKKQRSVIKQGRQKVQF